MAKAATVASSSLHPPYLEMICEAIWGLKERTGSSQPAIAKFIEAKYNTTLPPNFRKLLSVQLKKFLKSGKLVKVKNSYKISSSSENLKLSIKTKQTHNNNKAEKSVVKTKRLSQVKTPDALKNKPNKDLKKKQQQVVVSGSKVKRLSQVNTPEGLNRKPSTRSRK